MKNEIAKLCPQCEKNFLEEIATTKGGAVDAYFCEHNQALAIVVSEDGGILNSGSGVWSADEKRAGEIIAMYQGSPGQLLLEVPALTDTLQ